MGEIKRLSKNKIDSINVFFEEYIERFMFRDISMAMKDSDNYLAAQGLMVITEFYGGLLTGNLGIKNHSSLNFEAALARMVYKNDKKYYLNFEVRVKELDKSGKLQAPVTKGAYEVIRCGLLHEYFIKGNKSGVINDNTGSIEILPEKYLTDRPPGFWYDLSTGSIKFFTSSYSRDLQKSINEYKRDLIVKKNLILVNLFFKSISNLERRRIYKVKGKSYWVGH